MPLTKPLPYTEEDTAKIVDDYRSGISIEDIATNTGRSNRSIIAKLSREGVYISRTKPVSGRPTKVELITSIAEMISLDVDVIATLEKATHQALQELHDAIQVMADQAK